MARTKQTKMNTETEVDVEPTIVLDEVDVEPTVVSEPPHQCSECSKKYKLHTSLVRHLGSVHHQDANGRSLTMEEVSALIERSKRTENKSAETSVSCEPLPPMLSDISSDDSSSDKIDIANERFETVSHHDEPIKKKMRLEVMKLFPISNSKSVIQKHVNEHSVSAPWIRKPTQPKPVQTSTKRLRETSHINVTKTVALPPVAEIIRCDNTRPAVSTEQLALNVAQRYHIADTEQLALQQRIDDIRSTKDIIAAELKLRIPFGSVSKELEPLYRYIDMLAAAAIQR